MVQLHQARAGAVLSCRSSLHLYASTGSTYTGCCSQRTADCLTVLLLQTASLAALRAAADLRRHKHYGTNSTSRPMDLPGQHHTEAKRCSAFPAQQHYMLQGEWLLLCLPPLLCQPSSCLTPRLPQHHNVQ